MLNAGPDYHMGTQSPYPGDNFSPIIPSKFPMKKKLKLFFKIANDFISEKSSSTNLTYVLGMQY